MGLKLFGVGGIDQKSNNLLRDPKNLLDSRNVMANIEDEYIKRPGTEEDTNFTDDDYNDMIFIKSLNQYFHRFGTDYVSYENGTRKVIHKFADPISSGSSNISLAEYLDTAIFTHEENQIFTAKYDGKSIYRSGLPTPELTDVQTGTAMAGFMLTFFDYIDAKGNQLFGPSTITPVTNENNALTINTMKDTGFYGGYLKLDTYTGFVSGLNKYLRGTGTAAERTITYLDKSPDIVVGSKIVIRNTFYTQVVIGTPSIITTVSTTNNFFFLSLEIESIDIPNKTIVFTAASFTAFNSVANYSVVLADGESIDARTVLRYYWSEEEVTGYSNSSQLNVYRPILVDNSTSTNTGSRFNLAFNTAGDLLLSDIYDITTSKLRPPKCKYVYTYGFQLVCAPALSFFDFQNKEVLYTNNDLVMYSDTSTGDLGESFSEGNRQLIGNTYDGEIAGLVRVKDSMIVFKTRSPYALDGVLIPGQYTMRKIETNEIGCTSAKSILSIDNGVIFQAQDGLYSIDGYKCEKVTKSLDKFFKTINNTLTRSVMNSELDQYIFWTDEGIVVFDYEYKRWYIWDSIDGSKGLTVDNSLSLRFFGPTLGTKFKTALNDYGLAINAYIRSAWLDLGEPGLLKKATFLRVYGFNNAGQSVSLKYYQDWSESKVKGPFTIDMSDADTKAVKKNLDIIQGQSFSFEFRNNVIDEDLNISGYEVTTGIIQERDKNVK